MQCRLRVREFHDGRRSPALCEGASRGEVEPVLIGEGSPDELRDVPVRLVLYRLKHLLTAFVYQGQGGARREVQELVHHGRARGLASQNFLL